MRDFFLKISTEKNSKCNLFILIVQYEASSKKEKKLTPPIYIYTVLCVYIHTYRKAYSTTVESGNQKVMQS